MNDGYKKSPFLIPLQRERTSDKARVLKVSDQRSCVFCHHFSINSVPENDDIYWYNKEVDDVYEKRMEEWQKFSTKKETDSTAAFPKDPFSNKIMKRAPVKSKHRNAILKCMCLTSMCVQKDSDIGSTCPIKCHNKESGERYPYDNTNKTCTCPLCSCPCSRAFFVSDIHRLRLINHGAGKNAAKKAAKKHNDVKACVGTIFKMGLDAALAEQKNKIAAQFAVQEKQKQKQTKPISLIGDSDNIGISGIEKIDESYQYIFNETVATNMVKNADQLFDREAKKQLADQLGSTTTVTLPSGNLFSTKTIANNSNKHMRSNKLSPNPKTLKSPSSGMLHNVKIDLSVQPYTEDYLRATADFNMSKNEIIILDDDDKVPRVTPMKNQSSGETSTQNTPRSRALARVKKRVATQMHYGKKNLTTTERMQRKRAQNLTMDLVKNKDTTKDVIEVVCADMDINTDNYCSQEVVSRVAEYFDFERKANSEKK